MRFLLVRGLTFRKSLVTSSFRFSAATAPMWDRSLLIVRPPHDSGTFTSPEFQGIQWSILDRAQGHASTSLRTNPYSRSV